ncbi:MAG: tetratricopeptide repeat protein, partial [Nitrososphaeraceae archaeon]|nr:tetratricopeptide repeat protein [Nitrososphaeraceae archaeon]
INLLPVSGIVPINNIFAEHYLYLPSVSLFLLFSYLIFILYIKFNSDIFNVFLILFLNLLTVSLIYKTTVRNLEWRDPVTFYKKSLLQSPSNIPIRHNLAMTYAEKGEIQKAISQYKFIIDNGDYYPHTHHNLANLYKEIGEYKDAETEYKKALQIDPSFTFSYFALMELYKQTDRIEKYEQMKQNSKNIN